MEIQKRDILKLFFIFFIFLYLMTIILLPIVTIFHIDLSSLDYRKLTALDLIISLAQTVIVICCYGNILKRDYRAFKEDTRKDKILEFIKDVIIGFFLFMVFKLIGAYLSELIGFLLGIKDLTSDNQNTIELLTGSAPAMMMISTVILAPILEEMIFRGAIRTVIKNKKVFITVSGLIFGSMHFIDSEIFFGALLLMGIITSLILDNSQYNKKKKILLSIGICIFIALMGIGLFTIFHGSIIEALTNIQISEIIGGITYIAAGLYLAYLYATKDNIYLNIGVHALNNLFSMIVILFLQ